MSGINRDYKSAICSITRMSFLFGGARDPARGGNTARELQSTVRSGVRSTEREISRIEREEKILLAQLKKCGTPDKLEDARLKARELVRCRAHRARLNRLKTGLTGLSRELSEINSSHKIHETLARTTLMLQKLNGQLGVAGAHRMMIEFEKQSTQMAAKQEIVDEALESAFEGDNEDADVDGAILRVLEEAGLEDACKMHRLQHAMPVSPRGENLDVSDLDARLRALKQ